MRQIHLGFVALLAVSAASAQANTNFSSSHHSTNVRVPYEAPKEPKWIAGMGLGLGSSQVVVERQAGPIVTQDVRDSSGQLSLNLMLERMLAGPLGFESGAVLSSQIRSPGGFRVRFVNVPAMLRVHFIREFSIGLGGFAAVPVHESDLPEIQKLGAADFGAMGTARLSLPASKSMDWVVDLAIQRGLTHILGDSPGHLRTFTTSAGIAARL